MIENVRRLKKMPRWLTSRQLECRRKVRSQHCTRGRISLYLFRKSQRKSAFSHNTHLLSIR